MFTSNLEVINDINVLIAILEDYDVYFIGELLNDNYELDVVYESPIFKNMGDLLEEIGEKIEIEFTQIDKR